MRDVITNVPTLAKATEADLAIAATKAAEMTEPAKEQVENTAETSFLAAEAARVKAEEEAKEEAKAKQIAFKAEKERMAALLAKPAVEVAPEIVASEKAAAAWKKASAVRALGCQRGKEARGGGQGTRGG